MDLRQPNHLAAIAIVAGAVVTGVAFGGGPLATGLAATLAAWALLALDARRQAALAEARRRMLTHTAHELRTPLTSVLTALELVRGGYAATPTEADEFLAEADLAARHLGCLVDDVLDEAMLAAGRLQLVTVPQFVAGACREAAALLAPQATRRGQALHLAIDERAAAAIDAQRLRQTLFNLLGNAVKYAGRGAAIGLEVTVSGDRVRFAVRDDGPGVPEAVRPRLFQPFAQQAAHGVPSAGLGLHITRELVERMGGTIGHRAIAPRGSEFWFELPRANVADVETVVASAPAAAR
jgi:signal transduction histidine kinase